MESYLTRIQKWYRSHCDGDWEHALGIKIETLDNPGWWVTIDLEDSALENAQYHQQYDNGIEDWIFIEIKDKKYSGGGDPDKLEEVLRIFLDEILPLQIDSNFTYPIYAPIPNSTLPVWQEVKAVMITESVFEIVEIGTPQASSLQILNLDDWENLEIDGLESTEYKVGDKVETALKPMYDSVKPVIIKKAKE